MDYENKYKELLARLQKAKENEEVNDERYCCVIDDIVPELKESNDERIRRKLLKMFNDMERDEPILDDYGLDKLGTIAWIEKQSQTFTKKDVDDAYLKGVCDAKHELEKQGADKPYYTELLGYFEIGKRLNHSVEEIIDWLKSKI